MKNSKKLFPIAILGTFVIIVCGFITYKTFISKDNLMENKKAQRSKILTSDTNKNQSDDINLSKLGYNIAFSDVYTKKSSKLLKIKIINSNTNQVIETDDKTIIDKLLNLMNKITLSKSEYKSNYGNSTYSINLYESNKDTDFFNIQLNNRIVFRKYSANNVIETSPHYDIDDYEEFKTELDNLFNSLTYTPLNNSEETTSIEENCNEGKDAKPVIYLYPTSEQNINVNLNYKGKLTCTYPEYKDGWKVTAKPDGTLTNLSDNREYSYLFWEGISDANWDLSKGFVVKGDDTEKFLQEKLAYLGLTPKEYNEFIVYWLPIMQENKYNLITFAGEEYEDLAKLTITPKPDSILRVMMVFKPLDKPVNIEPQELKTFERKGFTVVEWGGTKVK